MAKKILITICTCEEVDFVFQPNKHLENTYFSDSQKVKKKCFKFRLKMEVTENASTSSGFGCYQFTIKTNMKGSDNTKKIRH